MNDLVLCLSPIVLKAALSKFFIGMDYTVFDSDVNIERGAFSGQPFMLISAHAKEFSKGAGTAQ
jgi:hypothetical protein